MTHVRKEERRLDASIIEAFRELAVATVYEAYGRKGFVDPGIRPAAPGLKICGPAYTVQCAPGDNLMLHKALQRASKGSVIVAAVGGAWEFGYWGGLMATAGLARGLAGLAIDGCTRDSAEVVRMGFPVFGRGFAIRGTTKANLGIINYPLNFGGATVFQGDLILGDDDGMVVVRFEDAAELLQKARARVEYEDKKAAQLRGGVTSVELNDLEKVFAALGLVEE